MALIESQLEDEGEQISHLFKFINLMVCIEVVRYYSLNDNAPPSYTISTRHSCVRNDGDASEKVFAAVVNWEHVVHVIHAAKVNLADFGNKAVMPGHLDLHEQIVADTSKPRVVHFPNHEADILIFSILRFVAKIL